MKQKLMSLIGMVMLAMGLSSAQGLVLHGIPNGDYTNGFATNASDTVGGGSWTHAQSWANAGAVIVGSEADRHLELWQEWYPRLASQVYVDSESTPLDQAWMISADLKWSNPTSGIAKKTFALTSSSNMDDAVAFKLEFASGSVTWTAGSQSGTANMSLNDSWQTASIEYDPVLGLAVGKLGTEEIFSVNAGLNLQVKTVGFRNYADVAYDAGTLSVDNVKVTSTPAGLLPGGDFSEPNFVDGKPTQIFLQGKWSYYQGGAIPCDVIGSGADRHAEINKESVYWNSSAIWYTSTLATSTDMMWTYRADLKSSYFTGQPMTFQLLDVDENVKFELKFSANTINWIAGGQTGSFVSATGLDTTWRTASISYNALTGLASANFGNETVFSDVAAGVALSVKQIKFGVWSYANTGTLFIDNVSFVSAAVPTPAVPTFSLSSCYISAPKSITMSCETPDAVIHYTTNGDEPMEASTVYSTAVLVGDGTILKARAYKAGLAPSKIKTMTYTIPASYARPAEIPQVIAPMTIDGNLADWAGATWIPLDQFYDGYCTDIQNASYAAKWGSDGKIYVAIQVQEASAASYGFTSNFVSWQAADQVEIYLHTTSGLVGYDQLLQEAAQQYYVGITSGNHSQVWKSLIAGASIPESAGFQAAGSADANGLIVYEVAMTAFEYFGGLAGNLDILSPLVSGDVIGLDVVVAGFDGGYTGMKSENMTLNKWYDWMNLGLHKLGAASIPGDANGDGMVDVGDLGILAANYGGSDKTWAQGDFNGDGLVDVGDLGILAAHYGEGVNASLDFSADYAKAFGTTVSDNTDEEVTANSACSGLGLPLIAGLALMGLMLVKLEE